MNNKNKYNQSRFVGYIKGFFPSIQSLFSSRNKNVIILNSFHNTFFSDNTKFLFEYLVKNEKKEVYYVINDDVLREKLIKKYGSYFIETKSKEGKKITLSAYLWITNSFELPISGIFLKFRRTVIQLTHGAPIKNAGLCEHDVSFIKKVYYFVLRTNFSYVLSTSHIFDEYIAKHLGVKTKAVLTNSYPRYDPLFNKQFFDLNFDKNYKHILYAPTWRHYATVKLFPFEDINLNVLNVVLEQTKVFIYLRIHPRFEDKIPKEYYMYSNIKIFSGKNYSDINDYMDNFDALITDYSSIMYDFMILDKPIFYFDYDYKEYEKNIGFSVDYDAYAIGYHSKNQRQFILDLNDAFLNDSYREKRNKISRLASGSSNHNSKDLIELLKEKKIF